MRWEDIRNELLACAPESPGGLGMHTMGWVAETACKRCAEAEEQRDRLKVELLAWTGTGAKVQGMRDRIHTLRAALEALVDLVASDGHGFHDGTTMGKLLRQGQRALKEVSES